MSSVWLSCWEEEEEEQMGFPACQHQSSLDLWGFTAQRRENDSPRGTGGGVKWERMPKFADVFAEGGFGLLVFVVHGGARR